MRAGGRPCREVQALRVFAGSLPSTPISLMHGQAAITLPVRGLPKAGIDSKYVQDIERGEANPTLAMLVAIAQALDLTLAELLEGV